MTKPRKTKDPHIQLFHEVIEGIAYAKLKPTEWQFIMVLWRLTYGRKNMQGQDGMWTPWVNAEWCRRTGHSRQNINRTFNSLLKKRVIKKKKGLIGFNKHFEKWAKECSLNRLYSPGRLQSKRSQNRLQVSSKQTTGVVSTDYKDAHKALASDDPQLLKKERKKEIHTKSQTSDKSFEVFWGKYPKKNDNKKAARKAWDKHYLKGRAFTLDRILEVLQIDVDGVFKDASENKYIPGAGPWLNRERWTDVKEKVIDNSGPTMLQLRIASLKSDLKEANHKVGLEKFDQKDLELTIKHILDDIHKLEKERDQS